MTDNEIKDFFHKNKPSLRDEATYTAELSNKLNAMSEIKKVHDESIHHHNMIFAIIFSIGLIIGLAYIAYLYFAPDDLIPQLDTLLSRFRCFFSDGKNMYYMALAVSLSALALTSLLLHSTNCCQGRIFRCPRGI